jgi:hypothetical protein
MAAKLESVITTGVEELAGRVAPQRPQTGVLPEAASDRTRFAAPHFAHLITELSTFPLKQIAAESLSEIV